MTYKKVLFFAGAVAVVAIVAIAIFLNIGRSNLVGTWTSEDELRGITTVTFQRDGSGYAQVSWLLWDLPEEPEADFFTWYYEGDILTIIPESIYGYTQVTRFNIEGSGRNAVLTMDGVRWYRQ